MTPEQNLLPRVSFDEFPLPELRITRDRQNLIGAEILSGHRSGNRIVHLRLLSADIAHREDAFEVVGTEAQMQKLSRLLSETMPATVLHGTSPHLTITEIPSGDILVCLKQAGRQFLEAGGSLRGVAQVATVGRPVLTDERIHPSLQPPFVTSGDRTWYYRESQSRGPAAFLEDILRDGWVRMDRYRPI